MTQPQYALSWDSYKTNICSGFSSLQQNAEFVDMTLAADGHFVKVHQILVALASPYIKELIASTPCQHPVIFLNNVSNKVLTYLLEFIYTGEVVVPSDNLPSFMEAAKSLHIKGLEGIGDDPSFIPNDDMYSIGSQHEQEIAPRTKGVKRKATTSISETLDTTVSLPRSARKVVVMPENSLQNLQPSKIQIKADSDFTNDFPDLADSGTQDSDDGVKLEEATDAETEKVKSATSNLLFTVSIRGSLQVILNRYIYNLNSTTTKAGLRRWRCVDYRNNKCTAFLVTKGNVVMNRANPHTHPFHDKKILAKIEKKAVFSALDDVEAYRDKEKELDKQDRIEERQLNEELILG